MLNNEQKAQIIEEMTPLIEKAEKEGLLFEAITPHQDIVITVKELKENLLTLYFTWSSDHWRLITYESYREQLIHVVLQATNRLKEFDKRYTDSISIPENGAIMLLKANHLSWEEFKKWMDCRPVERIGSTIYGDDIDQFVKKNGHTKRQRS